MKTLTKEGGTGVLPACCLIKGGEWESPSKSPESMTVTGDNNGITPEQIILKGRLMMGYPFFDRTSDPAGLITLLKQTLILK